MVAERYSRKRLRESQRESRGEGGEGEGEEEEQGEGTPAIDMYTTSCKRECLENFHESGKDRAMDEVAKLYELVKNMPDGPQKAHFLKRVSLPVCSISGCGVYHHSCLCSLSLPVRQAVPQCLSPSRGNTSCPPSVVSRSL